MGKVCIIGGGLGPKFSKVGSIGGGFGPRFGKVDMIGLQKKAKWTVSGQKLNPN